MPVKEFDQRFKPLVDYPADRACTLYLGYARTIGASKEALDHLARIINVTQQEYDMATKKSAEPKAAKAAKANHLENPKAMKPELRKKLKENIAKYEKSEKAGKAAKAAKNSEGRKSAAQMFKDLIMEGKLTDDKIFEKVQAEYGLDDKKRSYVNWYRNDLRKKGENPPEPK